MTLIIIIIISIVVVVVGVVNCIMIYQEYFFIPTLISGSCGNIMS